ncbi:MAG TPA: DegT/DnrJ/EryC1/StrS family aminotransferase [Bacteroidales bacterium]|nr:DegT/DnrJ/EryC1/StrS family aminotransferase [Bacteroidales bacterium]HQK67022.1 DegT/DnrJ/EryC1/StrS family aminotransferase [Bacteroidales bacterium]
MMIRYYSPHFSVLSCIKALFTSRAESKLVSFFKEYTNKKYILVTNSCRSALYLAYKSLNRKGTVVTNPLTCNIALDPIVAAGNHILFTDIERDKLTMLATDLHKLMDENTIAIQANHIGGFLCNMRQIWDQTRTGNICIIEDCAQGFFSSFQGQKPGNYSDVVCFSLIKNAYGTGGGILATDDPIIHRRATEMMQGFKKPSFVLILFRMIRNLLETLRDKKFFDIMYINLMRGRKVSGEFRKRNVTTYYDILPSKLEMKIGYVQLLKASELNRERKIKAGLLLNKLNEMGLISNYKDISEYDSAFTKFFMVNQNIRSEELITKLNKKGVEARHLEHKHNHFYQERIDLSGKPEMISNILECHNYLELYNRIISLPLFENMSEATMDKMIKTLKELIFE